jgi:hypothetical protein
LQAVNSCAELYLGTLSAFAITDILTHGIDIAILAASRKPKSRRTCNTIRRLRGMKRIYAIWPAVVALVLLFVPELVMAAGGKAEMLIVVADNRVVESSWSKFWVDTYNTDPFMFGLYCTLFTAFLGVSLGFITDRLMGMTGLDLTSRKIVEH